MRARLTTFLIWAAVLAGAVAWGLPLFTTATPVPAGTSLAVASPPAGAGLGRLLGQPPAQPLLQEQAVVADSRFRLVGVVAPRVRAGTAVGTVGGAGSASGLALISVDGKPARALGVGRELEPGLRLLSVGHRQVQLGVPGGAPALTLTLPALADAQRGRPGEVPAGMPSSMLQGMLPGMQPGNQQGMVVGQPFPGQPALRLPNLQQSQNAQMGLPPVQVPQGGPDAGQNNLPYQPDVNGNPMPAEPAQPPATAPKFQ